MEILNKLQFQFMQNPRFIFCRNWQAHLKISMDLQASQNSKTILKLKKQVGELPNFKIH